MWATVASEAADDAGTRDILSQLESIDIVYCQSWQYDDAVARLAGRLGAEPARRRYSGIGGSVPQVLASEAARSIAAGDLALALVVGAEALATVRRLKKAGQKPQWSYKPEGRRPFPMDMEFHPSEISHAVFEAYLTFALFDNARRAHLGRGLDEHRAQLGRVMAPMTEVAAHSPHAWFRQARSAPEIATPTADNRLVAYPYTKLMTSIMDVDMAAAVVLASSEKADALGVPENKRVYLRGSGYAEEPPNVAAHEDLWRAPAMAAAIGGALAPAGLGVDDVAHFDLYSCFASSVCFALDALGMAEDDGRAVTQTGGLPYHGGPGSNYMTHSLAAMAETLRADPGSFGLVSGVGMHMQKHVYGLWSTSPGEFAASAPAPGPTAAARRTITASHEGPATVATYSVLHGRDGQPESALLVCDLANGSRCYARLDDRDALGALEKIEPINRSVMVTPRDAMNVARFV